MGYEQEQIDIESLFSTAWGATTPIDYDNGDFSPDDSQASYVTLTVINAPARQVELGKPTNNYRHFGRVVVQVFTPLGEGTAEARSLSDQVANIFRSQFVGTGIVMKTPSIVRVGITKNWYQINVEVPFHRDETL